MKNEKTNIYVIYKFCMGELVEKRLNNIKEENKNISFYNFDYKNIKRKWKKVAEKKMQEASMVLFFYDNEAIPTIKDAENIRYELELAKKYKRKIITIYSKDIVSIKEALNEAIDNTKSDIIEHDDVAAVIFGCDYSGKDSINDSYKELDFKRGKEKVLKLADWSIDNLFTGELSSENEKDLREQYYDILLKQYEIMIETSENLIERRGAMSDKYRTLCITLISLVTASIAIGNLLLSGVAFLFVGIIIWFISRLWTSALNEYSKNNEGKYAVINAIETKLPANMFDTEYTYNKYRGIKTYSEREKSFPLLFKIIGAIFFLVGIIITGLGIYTIVKTGSFDFKSLFDLLNIIDDTIK